MNSNSGRNVNSNNSPEDTQRRTRERTIMNSRRNVNSNNSPEDTKRHTRERIATNSRNHAETLTLTVTGINSEGTGISRTESGVVFVHGALPGEKVRARIVARKKDFAVADTVSVDEASPGRVSTRCRYYGRCGGCQLQHAGYTTQLQLKAGIVRDAMTRIGGFDPEIFAGLTCEPSPESWGYRNKAAFPVQDMAGRIVTGFYRAGTHRLELIRTCPVNAKRLNEMYTKILDGLTQNHYPFDGYSEATHTGKLRHIITRTGMNTGESLLSFVVNGKLSAKSVKSLASLGNLARPDTLTVNHNSKPGNVILGSYTESLTGTGTISERLGEYRLMFDTASFFQVNTGQAEKLFSYAAMMAGDARNILELYSGAGSLTCWLAGNAVNVTSVEEYRGAVKMAVRNLEANNLGNVRALCGRSEEVIADLRDSYDAVVLDPPRDGCDRAVLEAVCDFGVRRVVYVSCNPATLARDCRVLAGKGYRLEGVRAFDMFPQTAHVESVAVMVR
ncbi:MAG: 23S rRNA (uracil(1939)-C(5))-methyltransferase RlmD [Synergistaceae bacterium]|nr:23S rRNA (uracil(1939)-C(5))-methyltransferase RlmD [Synergistaceae bacterium]